MIIYKYKMVLTIKVLQKQGIEVKGLFKRKRLYEDSYLPKKEGNHIYLPIRSKKIDNFVQELKTITSDYSFIELKLRENNRTRSFRRELQKILPRDIFNSASRAYEQIGDIGIITIFPQMEKYEKQIAKALMETNKGIRLVLKKISKYSGKKRIQEYEVLAGSGTTETTHIENGVKINLNVKEVYFSGRTANERKRICSLIRNPEIVLVLFSGCAPYPLAISKNTPAKEVWSIEINKSGHEYGLKNISLNSLSNIHLICGDVREKIKSLNKSFDRIIMPHPTEADYFLEDALSVLNKKGVVHMYLFSKPEKVNFVKNKIKQISEKKGYCVRRIDVVEQLHVSSEVKKYCFDIYYK